jgi:hypothetical protein
VTQSDGHPIDFVEAAHSPQDDGLNNNCPAPRPTIELPVANEGPSNIECAVTEDTLTDYPADHKFASSLVAVNTPGSITTAVLDTVNTVSPLTGTDTIESGGFESIPAGSDVDENDHEASLEELDEFSFEDEDNLTTAEVSDNPDYEELAFLDDGQDFNELDYFDQRIDNDYIEYDKLLLSAKLSRKERARQVAAEVLARHNWDYESLELLTEIFTLHLWGRCRVAIEKQMRQGLTPDELALAHEIRIFWKCNEQFWASLYTSQNIEYSTTNAIYQSLSWVGAIEVVRAFNGTPDAEELCNWIEEIYQLWYLNESSMRRFPSFSLFLKNQSYPVHNGITSNTHYTCRTDEFYSSGEFEEFGNSNVSKHAELLSELGIQLNSSIYTCGH